jgi:glycosyltransferase involved in cell wall biosynthesis
MPSSSRKSAEAAARRPDVAAARRRPIRILLIAPSMDILGGQAVQANRLIRELRQEPHLVVDFQPINPRLPAWIRGIPYLRTALTLLVYCGQILWRIPRHDVIHTFSAGLSSFALWTVPAVYVSRAFGKKVILNYRDGQAEVHLETWRLAKPGLLRASAVVAPSDYVVEVFRKRGIPARRIANVIDLDRFRYRQRRALRPVFMTNRILEPLYNVGCVLRAFAIVQRRYPQASLTVAHDGVCRPELEALARELGLRNTRFIGRVPQDRVPELYDAADIYLTSPNIDCMPGSLLECFASGLPVIATRAGGIPYLVTHEDTGLLVDVNDHEAMAACALRLLEDPDLVERSTRRARRELVQYRWPAIRRQWLDTYEQLFDNGRRLAATGPPTEIHPSTPPSNF